MPMTRPPPHGQPQLFCNWGEVMICALPLVWHCVVFGATVVHWGGAAAATGAIAIAAQTPATAKSGVRERSLVRIVGLLNGPRKTWLAAAVAATATDNQRGTVELVIPRIHISWFGRCGIDLNVAGRCAFGCGAAEGLCATGIGAEWTSRQAGRRRRAR